MTYNPSPTQTPAPTDSGLASPTSLPSAEEVVSVPIENPSISALVETLANGALAIVAYAILGVLLLIVGFYVIDLVTPGKLSAVLRAERNLNATLIAASGIAGIGLIVAASIWSSGGALRDGLLATLVYGLVGIAAQTVGMIAFDKVAGISVRELTREQELQPAAILLAVTHLVIGLITAVAVI